MTDLRHPFKIALFLLKFQPPVNTILTIFLHYILGQLHYNLKNNLLHKPRFTFNLCTVEKCNFEIWRDS